MTTVPQPIEVRNEQRSALTVALLLMVAVAGVAAAAIVQKPILALALAVGLPMLAAMIAWPNLATLAVMFVLYTNAAVVAVKFHGVPYFAGAAVPLALGIPLAYAVVVRRERIVIDPVFPLAVLFLVFQVASALFADNRQRAFSEVSTMALEGLVLFFLITNAVRSKKVLRQAVWALLIAGSFLGGLSLLQGATKTYRNDYAGFAQIEEGAAFTSDSGRTQRQGGPVGRKNRYAQIMLMLVPLGLACAWGENTPWLRAVGWASAGLIMIGVALTFSRGAAVGFVIVLAVMVWMRSISLGKVVGIAGALLLVLLLVPQLGDRMRSLIPLASVVTEDDASLAESDGSIRSRAAETMSAGLMFADHPILGVGPGNYSLHFGRYARHVGTETPGVKVKEEPRRPHILYLGIAAETGICGLFTFLLIVGLLLRNLNAVRMPCLAVDPRLGHIITGLFLGIVAYLATGLFLHLAFMRYLWLFLGLAAAGARIGAAEVAQHQLASARLRPCPTGDHS